jgi:ribonuclease P protein component
MSIPREHRLRKHSEFELVYRSGRRHFSPVLTAFYLVRGDEQAAGEQKQLARDRAGQQPQVGITVGRALGTATARNRIKRRVRAAVTKNLPLLTRPVDVVINPKKAVAEMDFQHLCDEVAKTFVVIEQKTGRAGSSERNGRSQEKKMVHEAHR